MVERSDATTTTEENDRLGTSIVGVGEKGGKRVRGNGVAMQGGVDEGASRKKKEETLYTSTYLKV
jgi:hypothetical protein